MLNSIKYYIYIFACKIFMHESCIADLVPSKTTIYKWEDRFKKDEESLGDQRQSGWQKTA